MAMAGTSKGITSDVLGNYRFESCPAGAKTIYPMELIFWTSVGLSIVSVISVAILVIKFYNLPNPLSMLLSILGSLVALVIPCLLSRIVRRRVRKVKVKDVTVGKVKMINSKEVAKEDDEANEFTFSERPFNSYELYN
jgi:hypothetical protein